MNRMDEVEIQCLFMVLENTVKQIKLGWFDSSFEVDVQVDV